MQKSILFVDDEPQILKAINRVLIDTEYKVFFADSGEEALRILDQEKINMIISDMRMPHMDGYQLLKRVKEKYPLVLRLILSGYSEENTIFKVLQSNLAKLYLLKPWDNQKFLEIIQQVFELEAMIQNDAVLAVINTLGEIPTMPVLYQKLCKLIEKDADIKTISSVVEEDPAVASKILHIANSAFFRLQTGSVNKAILYLGLAIIKDIILMSSVFSGLKTNSKIFSKELLWQHSCLCNKLVIAFYEKHLDKDLPEAYMSAGLLHDIGEIVLLNNFEEQYNHVQEFIKDHAGISFVEAEREIMNISHQEIGGYLLNWWELPLPIVEAALFHHNPFDERIINKELVAMVHLADYYSWKSLGKEQFTHLNKDTFEFLNITEESYEYDIKEWLNC